MEKIQLLSCPVPQADVLHAMSEFHVKDVRKWFQEYALPKEKVSKPFVGKMKIENSCYPMIDDQEFLNWENELVFFAFGKRRISLLKSERRVFVWRPLSKSFFAVPDNIILLDFTCHYDTNNVGGYTFLLEKRPEKTIKNEFAYGNDHVLKEANALYREFSLCLDGLKATGDILKQKRAWSNYDWWAGPREYTKNYPAMHFLRNDVSGICLYKREYPREPHGFGGEIDE
ncbi:MAG: hypothetical protein IKL33_00750 [Alphaproteobacteria bacterium]|nr:hypothetical protein [Alphaproteobacteria bacterium]